MKKVHSRKPLSPSQIRECRKVGELLSKTRHDKGMTVLQASKTLGVTKNIFKGIQAQLLRGTGHSTLAKPLGWIEELQSKAHKSKGEALKAGRAKSKTMPVVASAVKPKSIVIDIPGEKLSASILGDEITTIPADSLLFKFNKKENSFTIFNMKPVAEDPRIQHIQDAHKQELEKHKMRIQNLEVHLSQYEEAAKIFTRGVSIPSPSKPNGKGSFATVGSHSN